MKCYKFIVYTEHISRLKVSHVPRTGSRHVFFLSPIYTGNGLGSGHVEHLSCYLILVMGQSHQMFSSYHIKHLNLRG
jgi:hypothetical protein